MGGGRGIAVYPDADRVEQALLRAAQQTLFVDASRFVTFSQWITLLAGPLERRLGTSLTMRVVIWGIARSMGSSPFGAFTEEPAFAHAALELFFDLKAGNASP